jgi:hypothetical protein
MGQKNSSEALSSSDQGRTLKPPANSAADEVDFSRRLREYPNEKKIEAYLVRKRKSDANKTQFTQLLDVLNVFQQVAVRSDGSFKSPSNDPSCSLQIICLKSRIFAAAASQTSFFSFYRQILSQP